MSQVFCEKCDREGCDQMKPLDETSTWIDATAFIDHNGKTVAILFGQYVQQFELKVKKLRFCGQQCSQVVFSATMQAMAEDRAKDQPLHRSLHPDAIPAPVAADDDVQF